MTKKQKTPQQIAEEQVSAEEAARREERIAEITAEEERRREAERKEGEALEARRKAAKEAEGLVEQRKPLEDVLQTKIAEIASAVDELAGLHDGHTASLRASLDPEYNVRVHDGIALGAGPDWTRNSQDVRQVIRSYLEGSLLTLYRDATAPKGTLAEADPLTPVDSDDPAGRPAGDFPWGKLEEAKREIAEKRAADEEKRRASDAAKKLNDLEQRHKRVRADYGRAVGFNELVVPEERTRLYELCTEEEIELFKQTLDEQNGGSSRGRPVVPSDMADRGPDAA